MKLLEKLRNASVLVKIMGVAVIAVLLYSCNTFFFSIPNTEENLMLEKKAQLSSLVEAANSIVASYEKQVQEGRLSKEEAQNLAKEAIRHMRYGDNGADYLWIQGVGDETSSYPTIIMHPTSPQLEGKPADDSKFNKAFMIANGKEAGNPVKDQNIFSAAVKATQKTGDGSVRYRWPRLLANGGISSEIYPKESYVKAFKPWGWIIGTGIYIDDVEAKLNSMRLREGITSGICMLILMLMGFSIARSISHPVKALVKFAGSISNGELDAKIVGTFYSEMKLLMESLLKMVAALKEKIAEADAKTAEAAEQTRLAQIATQEANDAKAAAERAKAEGMQDAAARLEKVVEIVSSASEELSAQIEQSSRGTEAQSQRVAETATAMEEMNATVLEVAKNASQAAEASKQAGTKAGEGAGIVGEVVASMNTVQGITQQLQTGMGELGKQAEGIGQIVEVISDIADQTNLLALNAAIEAARAGDAGRGFAVVADEVRKLAEKTMAATKEVGDAIRGVQRGVKTNIDNAGQAATAVAKATELAQQSGAALKEIVDLVITSADQVRSIATASEEQSAASEEINRSIEEINRISQETAAAMNQSAQAVGDLANQATKLRHLTEELNQG